MAVATSIDSSYFVVDVPDFGWSGVPTARALEFTVTPVVGSTVTFTDPCVADGNDSVVFRGLSQLLESYVGGLSLTSSLFTSSCLSVHALACASFRVTLHLETEETPVTSTLSSVAYYSRSRMSFLPVGCRMWLSRYHRRRVSASHPLVASSFVFPSIDIRLRVSWMSAGVSRLTELSSLAGSASLSLSESFSVYAVTPKDAVVLCYSLSAIASAVTSSVGSPCLASDICHVYADLLHSGSVVDTLEFEIDHGHRKLEQLVAFTNCWGMPEVESFTGSDARTTEVDGEYSWMDDAYVKTCGQEVTSHRLCAGSVTEAQRSSLRDLSSSPEVYLLRDGATSCWERQTVTGIEMSDRRPRTQPQTAYVTLRPSERHQEVVSRSVCPVVEGVFDETFDETFE